MTSPTGTPRILCIMGSGETAPTMSSVHAELLARMGPPPVPAVLLDTPFGFQENADDICMRAGAYFRQSVGQPISVATFRDAAAASPLEYETMIARVSDARYVFAGPGSPTYALRQWRGSPLPELLNGKLQNGGCVVFASAAAVTLGMFSLPVYEVYKVGEPPRWLDGLDLLQDTGLRAAVIPHYNNAEGGTHDTRFCYMGERRLSMLEKTLPDGVDVLGVDEHTACIFDLDDGTVTVRGRGVVTWRHRGDSRRFEAGTVMPIEALPKQTPATQRTSPSPATAPAVQPDDPPEPTPFMEEVTRQAGIADAALAGRDVDSAVAALLEIDTQLHEWENDTLTGDERDRARSSLRQYLVRLGDVARVGAADPRERVAPVVDRVLGLRRQLRSEGDYAAADRLRDLLVDAGIEVHDTPGGSTWDLAS